MANSDLMARGGNPRSRDGLAAVGVAFRRALVSQCHPKMILALFLPFVIALLGAIALLWVFWTPLTAWLNGEAAGWTALNDVDQWMVTLGLFSLKLYLIPFLALCILLPLSGILGLVIAAIFVMPIVLNHLDHRNYKGLARRGEYAGTVGTWNAVWVGLLFMAGWLLTMPLWLIPPLAIVLPVFWWAFAFTRMLRVDAIVEHASAAERKILWRRHNRQLWAIGACLAVANLLPPAWLILPVFSALVFAHFGLEALRQLRQEASVS
ncbi:MAG: EI24 domain-containing protein [Candidimonas sp.]|nr:MAG: EI24 domain-containing protein [Candidimonas sp.]